MRSLKDQWVSVERKKRKCSMFTITHTQLPQPPPKTTSKRSQDSLLSLVAPLLEDPTALSPMTSRRSLQLVQTTMRSSMHMQLRLRLPRTV
ncbi:hypothetical protein CISIN_1g047381mg [Citrus sinensis]|uniref:Uncharacterized protein n=1 Tax=Citrus sinensis TaxID=2711 RepID=A0A067GUK1_CITSI|nr:hypothetical protein CISIN_1g047381mg [Citrus sinensis]